jgi:signal transduction histidine kinase
MRPTLLLVVLLTIFFSPLQAQPFTHVFDKKELSQLTPYMASLPIEQATGWTIDDVIAHDSLFQSLNKLSYRLGGMNSDPIWVKFTIKAAHISPLLVEFAPSLADSISLFHVLPDGTVEKSETGQLMPFAQRALYNHNHTLLLRGTETQTPQVYYARIKVLFPMGLKLRVGQHEAFATHYHREDMYFGGFYGILFMVVLFSFLLYPAQSDIVYCWYALYLLSLVTIIAFYNGHLHEWFFQNTPQYNHLVALITTLPSVFGCLFAISFFKVRTYKFLGLEIIQWLMLMAGINVVLSVLGLLELSIVVAHVMSIPLLCLGVYLALGSLKKGNASAVFYLCGWLAFLASLILNFLDDAGTIPSWDIFRIVVSTGILIEAFFITAAQVARVAAQYKEKRAFDLQLIAQLEERQHLVNELNQNLERSVIERTGELKEAFVRVQEKETQLEDYAVKLERSNKELTEFAYIVSHDLKAPLRNIGSFTQLLDRKNGKNFDDRDREYMNYVLTSVKQASTLIDDLLNYSKLDKDIGDPTSVNLNRIMERVQLTLESHLRERHARLVYRNLPHIQAHSSLMLMLFQNLILNGIKYNESAEPIVEIGVSGVGERVLFWVRDNGIGIPPQYQQEVFKMFRRLHTAQAYEGTGIGLAFCKRIVATYGGDMWLESTVGEGTIFFFTLPRTVAEADIMIEDADLALSN